MKRKYLQPFFQIIFCLFYLSVSSQNVSLDPSFNFNGKVRTAVGDSHSIANALAIQNDGKIVVVGRGFLSKNENFIITRYLQNGQLDNSFNTTGVVMTDFMNQSDEVYSVVIQPDGKILVAGRSTAIDTGYFALARYLQNGSLDTSFDHDGKVLVRFSEDNSGVAAKSVALQSDGKIIAIGVSYVTGQAFNCGVIRLHPNGKLDSAFNEDGIVSTDVETNGGELMEKVIIQSDGKILVGGSNNTSNNSFCLIRYLSNGNLDSSFHFDGKLTTRMGNSIESIHDIKITPNNKIIAAGYAMSNSRHRFATAQYHSNGVLDSSFDSDGILLSSLQNDVDIGQSVLLQGDSKVIVLGRSRRSSNMSFGMIRYFSNGKVDSSLDNDGRLFTNFGAGTSNDYGIAAAMQADGKIVLVGVSYEGSNFGNIAIARYNNCHPDSFTQALTICEGQSVQVGTRMYTLTNVYRDTLKKLNGCDSIVITNLTVKPRSLYTQSFTICNGENIKVGSRLYSISNTYMDTLRAKNGCDSIITTILTVKPRPNKAITLSNQSLIATQSGAKYQWVDCSNSYQPIPSITSKIFSPTQSGSYAVIVNLNNCIDTSICTTFTKLSLDVVHKKYKLSVFPNPMHSELTIMSNKPLNAATIKLFNASGQLVKQVESISGFMVTIQRGNLASGQYHLTISESNNQLLENSLLISIE
jgi:uncharacterized delta-60 repeat protein